ncbi:MAG: c-type cytochrome [Steroidobacteraceae bacterium]
MKLLPAFVVSLSLLTAGATTAFAGDATVGARKSPVCGACHGGNGISMNPEWPNLAGQQESYIAAQLALFKRGIRDNPLMRPMAVSLSDQDMLDLGAYYAEQAPAGLEADPAIYESGERLYRGGDPERKLPACIACHGPQGKGNGPAKYPALRGQHAVYTYNQLKAYAENRRRTPGNDIMQVVAARLTENEMRALASYTQGLR